MPKSETFACLGLAPYGNPCNDSAGANHAANKGRTTMTTKPKSRNWMISALCSSGWTARRIGPSKDKQIRIDGTQAGAWEALVERVNGYGWEIYAHDNGATMYPRA